MAAIDVLLQEALKLSAEDRTKLGNAILDSVDDDHDGLDDEERRRLHAALLRSQEDVEAGRVRPASEVLTELRARSSPR